MRRDLTSNPITFLQAEAFAGLPGVQSLYVVSSSRSCTSWYICVLNVPESLFLSECSTADSSLCLRWLRGWSNVSVEAGAFDGLDTLGMYVCMYTWDCDTVHCSAVTWNAPRSRPLRRAPSPPASRHTCTYVCMLSLALVLPRLLLFHGVYVCMCLPASLVQVRLRLRKPRHVQKSVRGIRVSAVLTVRSG